MSDSFWDKFLGTRSKHLSEDIERRPRAKANTINTNARRYSSKESEHEKTSEFGDSRKIDGTARFSDKEFRLTKKSTGALRKSIDYCGPIRKKSYHYVSGSVRMAYNSLIEVTGDCYFDYMQAVLLRLWVPGTSTFRNIQVNKSS